MTASWSFVAQLGSLNLEVAAALAALNAGPAGGSTQFEGTRGTLAEALLAQQDGLGALGAKPAEPAEQWAELAAAKSACNDLFAEVLALLESAWARQLGLDQGLCALADHLLHDLDARAGTGPVWGRVTTIGTSEFIRYDSAVIRVKFPATSIWNLPIVAHEYGHFVGPRIQRSVKAGAKVDLVQPVQEHLKAITDSRARFARRSWWPTCSPPTSWAPRTRPP